LVVTETGFPHENLKFGYGSEGFFMVNWPCVLYNPLLFLRNSLLFLQQIFHISMSYRIIP